MATTALGTFRPGARMTLAERVALLALLLFCEKFLLNFFVDFNAAQNASGLGALVRDAQHPAFRFAVAFALSLALFAYARGAQGWSALDEAARGTALRAPWFIVHALLLLALMPLSYGLYGRSIGLPFALVAGLWVAIAALAALTLFAALAPWQLWRRAVQQLGVLLLYAAVAAAIAASAMQWSERLWAPTAAVTFDVVWQLLAPFIPSLQADPHTLILSSSRFAVQVSEVCSGLEGAGLVLVFCGAWLLCFRREYRFPQALMLIPAGLALSFVLNVLRIAVLMLIGYAGFPQIAVYGFHSQAGWIAFNCAAGLIAFASRRSAWLARTPYAPVTAVAATEALGTANVPPAATAERDDNPTAVYLLPLLVILAAGMLARAVSSGFETLYVVRLFAAGAALAWGWPHLRRLDWRCSWRGPAVGALVFGLWALAAQLLTRPTAMPAALAAMSVGARGAWLTARVAAAVVTVPLAEELAFRGYLMRRLVAADFEAVRFREVGATALIVSALAFGVEHGALWAPGVLAGLLYGVLPMRRNQFGEAVVAHAVTNALLAVYVLSAAQWQLW